MNDAFVFLALAMSEFRWASDELSAVTIFGGGVAVLVHNYRDARTPGNLPEGRAGRDAKALARLGFDLPNAPGGRSSAAKGGCSWRCLPSNAGS
jgi:hypothetical protein